MSIFNNYPYIYYNNIKARNIMLEGELVKNTLLDYNKFFKYTIKNYERPDILAYKQYNDSSLDWVLLLINNVVDPYKDWIMDDAQLAAHLSNKYATTTSLDLNPVQIQNIILHYYYRGLPSDTEQHINSFNYTMTPETYSKLGNPAGWAPVYAWDYEVELNESKREVFILRSNYVLDFVQQYKELFN